MSSLKEFAAVQLSVQAVLSFPWGGASGAFSAVLLVGASSVVEGVVEGSVPGRSLTSFLNFSTSSLGIIYSLKN